MSLSYYQPSPSADARQQQRQQKKQQQKGQAERQCSLGSTLANLSELRANAQKQIHEAIVFIPVERKMAYLEAFEKAPYLFENETDPLVFLRYNEYDIWKTAEQMCLYWKERVVAFGRDRAHLPLVLTGDGALNDDDILSLQAGFPAMLPDPRKTGRKAVFIDRRLYVPHLKSENRVRGIFYFSNKLVQSSESVHQEGFDVFFMLVTPRAYEVDLQFTTKCCYLGLKVLPLKIHSIHFLNIPPKQKSCGMGRQYMIQDVISHHLLSFAEMGFDLTEKAHVHFERGDGEVLAALTEDAQLELSEIPRDLGGSYDPTAGSLRWCRQQAAEELEKYKWLLHAARKEMPALGDRFGPYMGEEDIVLRKRAINAVNSRRKRARKRDMVTFLKEEHAQLVQENNYLIEEEKQLQALLQQAHEYLDAWGSEGSEDQKAPAATTAAPIWGLISTMSDSYRSNLFQQHKNQGQQKNSAAGAVVVANVAASSSQPEEQLTDGFISSRASSSSYYPSPPEHPHVYKQQAKDEQDSLLERLSCLVAAAIQRSSLDLADSARPARAPSSAITTSTTISTTSKQKEDQK